MISVFTGAGISAESGLSTFRRSGGLWEGHDVSKVATPAAWEKNPDLVNQFYNKRRAQLREVKPNACHKFLAELQRDINVAVITQNVDDLHEKAGSENVLHLHGELKKVHCPAHPERAQKWEGDLSLSDTCFCGEPLRPHVVWFGEDVPQFPKAVELVKESEMCLIIGTSLQVYPAAALVDIFPEEKLLIYVDPNPEAKLLRTEENSAVIAKNATEGIDDIRELLSPLWS